MKEISDKLIEQYFLGQLSDTDASLVEAYLLQHPEKDYWRNEWNQDMQHDIIPSQNEAIILDELKKEILNNAIPYKKDQMIVLSILKMAAIIGGVILLIFMLFEYQYNNNNQIVQNISSKNGIKSLDSSISNNTLSEKTYMLPDSSTVRLYPNSSLTYNIKSFGFGDRRDCYLTGKGYFNVYKNKKRPFTVFAGRLSTTALGTKFIVDNSNQNTMVALFQGKVVVKALRAINGWHKDVYLAPGTMVLSNKNYAFAIPSGTMHQPWIAKRSILKVEEYEKNKNEISKLEFNNDSLSCVLNQLASHYHVQIHYPNKITEGKLFSGLIKPTDSIGNVLRFICQMQGLSMRDTIGGYNISLK